MTTRYVAFGLELRASFPLPGMAPDETEGLPSLELDLTTPGELETAWSGPDGPPVWRGRLGDGCDLTIERGTAGDLLLTYDDRTHFRLDPSGGRLECAPRDAGLGWQRALLGRVLPNVGLARGREALHASAAESPRGVVAIAAASGMGKTTLTVELMRRGWPLFADDVLTLASDDTGVHAYPGTPHMNVAASRSDALELDELGTTLGTLAGECWMSARNATRGSRPVHAICLLERHVGLTLDARPLPSTPLSLAPYMLGLPDCDAPRERRRFALYSDLVSSATLIRLTGGLEDGPEDMADLLERILGLRSKLAAGGAA